MLIHEELKKYFGYDSFRGGQEELITNIQNGRDVLGIMPTGAGKSICFQLPALSFSGITLVVSPLISLMKDQVGALTQSGIPVAYINSSLTPRQMDMVLYNAKNDQYKLIYVAPERLLAPDFLAFAREAEIAMLTVDEAHCISQWGQDFRPSYAEIPRFIAALKRRPVISAFTATATPQVSEDIVNLLELQSPAVLVTGFDRGNLYFEVQSPPDKVEALIDFLTARQEKSGIIYCSTRKTVEEVCDMLKSQGFSAACYHAGLPDSERRNNQDDFLYDRVQIMVATNAFGMGIDKSNVSFVVHFNMPKDIESYYQEAGRAGRDGTPADCLLLYSGQDVRTNQWLIENSETLKTEEVLESDRRRLREMTFYSTTNDCLRAYILKYFGEKPMGYCGHCSNCNTKFEMVDITQEAQKILSCVVRMKERFGAGLVIDVLRGSKNKRIQEFGLNTLSTYGISGRSAHILRVIIDFLAQNDYLKKTDDRYPLLKLGERANDILISGVKVEMKLAKEKEKKEERVSKPSKKSELSAGREILFRKLREVRREIADRQSVPAFVVFSDSTLTDMCIKLPKTPAEFLMVSGVGEAKLERYGEEFMQAIIDFCGENLDLEGLEEAELSDKPVTISELVKIINEVADNNEFFKLSAVRAADWLLKEGYLQLKECDGRREKVPTEKGSTLGISQEERTGSRGDYTVNLYSSEAQKFVIDNVDKIY